jgi:hypothetical protein
MADHHPKGQYIVVNQSRDRAPTEYEDLFADALERLFGQGIDELGPLVEGLNELAAPSPNAEPWTEDLFLQEIKRLGA